MTRSPTSVIRLPMWMGFLLGIGALLAGLVWGNGEVEQWRLSARWTARVGFPLFTAAYIARPLVQVWRSAAAKTLLKNRKYIGLGFAVTHTIHLAALIMYFRVSGEAVDLITAMGGGAAYALLFAMTLTSNATSMKRLGHWWKRLHKTGIHALWFIFLITYAGRFEDPVTWHIGAVTTAVLILAGTVRFAAMIKIRR